MTPHRRGAGLALIAAIPTLFLLVFFGWPLAALFVRAVESSDGTGLVGLWARSGAGPLLAFTLAQAAASTLLTLIVAAPITWLVARVRFAGSRLFLVVVTLPFVLPSVVVGMAFRAVFTGPLSFLPASLGGALDDAGPSLVPVLCAHIFLNVAVVVRVVGAAWSGLDPRLAQAAQVTGAGPVRAFTTVTLPRLLPAIAAAGALVFLFCTTSYGVIMVLGNGRLRTVETAIYTEGVSYFHLPEAAALSVLQIVIVIVTLVVARLLARRAGVRGKFAAADRPSDEPPPRPRGGSRIAMGLTIAWAVLWLVLPLAVLMLWSVRPAGAGSWTLDGYRALGHEVNGITPLSSAVVSLSTAVLAALLAFLLGLNVAVAVTRLRGPAREAGEVIATIPLGVSAVTLGFGYTLVLAHWPSWLANSSLVIAAVQALVVMPLVIRIAVPALERVPLGLTGAAATLGANPVRVFATVELPVAARSLAAAGGFAFILSLGEFGATSFLARVDTTTLPVMIGTALNRPGEANLATAMACSVVLVIATALAVAVVEAVRPNAGSLL
ncbi:putative ABC transporter permease protein [Gordonia araii NBRC 100433]|uniref:Putative ABC transporter permease protein n=1 Tax=Gordonia araii NBRC 100433 TaxID=1073574 RepID=G7H432_9ACTN|nr:iron ABC transporter permease [Gordonia araii]NNG96328.1 iron ABC transporter permease [Gordonia araii NBRC 100433]GAB10607.1 putative ABC transporter permease protein [Gordonia araii NBRC 100433]